MYAKCGNFWLSLMYLIIVKLNSYKKNRYIQKFLQTHFFIGNYIDTNWIENNNHKYNSYN